MLQGFAVVLLVGLPALAARDVEPETSGIEDAAGFRRAVYLSVAVSLIVVAMLTWGVVAWQDVSPAELGWRTGGLEAAALWATGATLAGLAVAWGVTAAARRVRLRESTLAWLLMPRDAGEKRAFLLMAGVGATCEEYVYRGFLLKGLEAWTGSVGVAVTVTALSFGLAHGYQRLAGIVRATLLGGVLAVPVVWTGSLLPAVVGHFWINAAIGLGGWRLMARGSGDDREEGGAWGDGADGAGEEREATDDGDAG